MKFSPAGHVRRLLLPMVAAWLWCAALAHAGNPHPDFEVAVSGHGRPVIFIPGLATPGAIWQPVADQLRDTCQCHVISLCGFGKVPPSGTDPFLAAVRQELIDYIRGEKLEHPIIVGHSLGGFLGLWLAETVPELPGRLVIVDALPYLPGILKPAATPEKMRARIAPMLEQMADASRAQFMAIEHGAIATMVTSPENVAKVTALAQDSDPQTTARAMDELMTIDLRPDLSRIVCPVLVFVGLADKLSLAPRDVILADFRQQYAGLRGVRFVPFDRAKHYIMVDDPAGFLSALRDELKLGPAM